MLLLVGIHQLNVFVLVSVLFVLLMAKRLEVEHRNTSCYSQLIVFVLVSILFVLLMAKDWNTETEVSIHHFSVFILVSLLMVKD